MPSRDDPVTRYLIELRQRLLPVEGGEVASYIPELAKADPDHFAVAIVTTDGRVYAAGDAEVQFTIQSVSKPFAYGHAFASCGRAAVLNRVGVEPTGDPFNSIILDEAANQPYNPMVNAGAIAVAEMFQGETRDDRIAAMRSALSRFAGRDLAMDEAVFRSESETGHRNRAIAYLMRASGMLKRDPEEVLEIYFRQCSMLVDCRDLAVMAATLANDGVNPLTGEAAMPAEFVQDVLTVMHSCGMYDYAGQWSYDVGVPAKSGVSGCVIAVAPGQIGIAAYSPRLDSYGNSVRAVMACRQLSADFGLHAFRSRADAASVLRREVEGLQIRSKRVRPPTERASLDARGGGVRIIEAQGDMGFSGAEKLTHRIGAVAAEASHVIVDFAHVHHADAAASRLLQGFAAARGDRACPLAFSHLPPEGPLANLRLALAEAEGGSGRTLIFDRLDAALAHVEEEILGDGRRGGEDRNLSLAEIAIFQGLDADELQALATAVDPKLTRFEKGAVIIRMGEPGTLFFAIARGSVSVELPPIGSGLEPIQIASMGKGLAFGEAALVEGRQRAADVVADGDLACYVFPIEAFRAFGRAHPHIYVKILINVIRDLADTLSLANETVRALER